MEGNGGEGDESLWPEEGASDGKEAVEEEFVAEGEGPAGEGEQAEEGEQKDQKKQKEEGLP